MVVIYHPETQGLVEVPDEALPHYRQSGWVTREEWAELEALKAQRAQADDVPAKQPLVQPASAKKETK